MSGRRATAPQAGQSVPRGIGASQACTASHAVLVRVAASVGLDTSRAAQILASDEFTAEVRQAQQFWQSQGISAVPSVVINKQHLIQGGQPPEAFEQALRQIAGQITDQTAGQTAAGTV